MKKYVIFLLLFLLAICSACSAEMIDLDEEQVPVAEAAQSMQNEVKQHSAAPIGLVLDEAMPEDEIHLARIWRGISIFAEEQQVLCRYYSAAEPTLQARMNAVTEAVDNGAQIIFCYGADYEPVLYQMQYTYSDIEFVIFDGEPRAADYSEYKITPNVTAIYFAEEQVGFLAGYAAVQEGFTELAFMAGMPVSSVIRYGTGYLQGIYHAATELQKDVNVTVYYSGLPHADESVQSMAGSLYLNNTQLIFTCEEDFVPYVAAAAEVAGNQVIGVGSMDEDDPKTVLTCIEKEFTGVTYYLLEQYYNEVFFGGEPLQLNAEYNAIGLEMDYSHFMNFTRGQYDNIRRDLAERNVVVQRISDPAYDITTMYNSRVTVTMAE